MAVYTDVSDEDLALMEEFSDSADSANPEESKEASLDEELGLEDTLGEGDAEEAEDYAAGSRSPFDPETGRLTNEMRDFVRGTFNPMLRAGMTQLLLKRPNDPYAFLADFFWQHSSLNKYPDEGAGLTQRDRIVLGELRGAESVSFLRAINTGHPGSFSTIHANSLRGALEQLSLMVMQTGIGLTRSDTIAYAASVIDVVVQLSRDANGKRGIAHIAESAELLNQGF